MCCEGQPMLSCTAVHLGSSEHLLHLFCPLAAFLLDIRHSHVSCAVAILQGQFATLTLHFLQGVVLELLATTTCSFCEHVCTAAQLGSWDLSLHPSC